MALERILISIAVMCLYLFILVNVCMSQALGSNDGMTLEVMKQFCYPGEYNREDMMYINVKTSDMNAHLEALSSKPVQKLHISVLPSIDNWEIDVDNIPNFWNLTELWIVKDGSSKVMKMILHCGDTQKKSNVEQLHLKFSYDSNGDYNLQQFLLSMPNLQLLELLGTRYPGDPLSIMSALRDKPNLKVLKLNKFFTLGSSSTWLEPEHFFKPLINSSVMCLELCDNYLVGINYGMFSVLPHIRLFNVSHNLFHGNYSNYFIIELLLNPTIEIINFATQGYYTNRFKRSETYQQTHSHVDEYNSNQECKDVFSHALVNPRFPTCELIKCLKPVRHYPCSVFPRSIDISALIDFNCDNFLRLPLGQNIKAIIADEIDTSVSQYSPLKQFTICFAENQLETLSLANNAVYLKQKRFSNVFQNSKIIGLNSIENLNVSYNNLNILLPNSKVLNSFPNLVRLSLQGNNLLFENSSTDSICTFFPNLTQLDMSSSGISHIPQHFFSACGYNRISVNLANNSITEQRLSFSMDYLLRIRHLNLGYNKINFFYQKTRSLLFNYKGPKISVQFGGNPFICNCSDDSLETMRLFQSSPNKMITFVGVENYQCQQNYTGIRFQTIMKVNTEKIQDLCHPKYVSPYVIAVAVGCSLMLLLILGFMIYKYRFYILTCFYKSKVRLRCQEKQKHSYLYDIFIAYCSEDRKWVHKFLMKTLEDRYNFTLCIHLRYVYMYNIQFSMPF